MATNPEFAQGVGGGVGGLFGGLLGRRRARKKQERRMATAAGQAIKAQESEAMARQISKDYGMSKAERREAQAEGAESARSAAREGRRNLMRGMMASGGFGRSGAATDALVGLERNIGQAVADVGSDLRAMDKKFAFLKEKEDKGLTERGFLRQLGDEAEADQMARRFRKRGAAIGSDAVAGFQKGMAERAS